jgi:O-antigen ligase
MAGLELFFFYLLGAASCLSLAAVNAAQVALSLFFLYRLVRGRWKPAPPEWILVAFLAWNVVSALLSPLRADALDGVLDFWSWSALLVAAALPQKVREHASRFTLFLAVSAALTVPMSLCTFFLGTDFHMDALTKKVPVGTIPAYGYFSHHLTYAGVMALAALFVGGRALYGSGTRRAWWGASSLSSVAGVLLSVSRAYTIALVPGAAVLLWKKGRRWMIAALCTAAAVGVLAVALGPAAVKKRAASLWDLQNASNAERIYLWVSGFHMWQERPVLGWGPGTYEKTAGPYKAPYAEKVHYPDHEGFKTTGHCHNTYLMVAIQSGAVGLALFLAFCVAALVRMAKHPDPAVRYGAMAAFTAFLVGGLFEFNGGDAEVATLAFFLVGLALRDGAGETESRGAGESAGG